MRTTLDSDDEILPANPCKSGSFTLDYRDGVPVLPRRPNPRTVTTELVNRLLNEQE